MKKEEFRKMYHGDDPEKREVLFKMADAYREMINIEHRLIDHRATWFLTLNGFLFAAFGIILAYYKGSHCFLIFVSLVFAVVGYVLAQCVYKKGIESAGEAISNIHIRWLNFLKTFFDYSPENLNEDCYVPPIMGRLSGECMADIQNGKQTNALAGRSPDFLAHVMAWAWIALFAVVFIFNTAPCLKQSVSNNPTCPITHVSQGGTANLINLNYDSNVEMNPLTP